MWKAWAAVAALVLAAAGAARGAEDRLARFGELGRALSGDGAEAAAAEAALAEMFALADAEIEDSLRAGEPYASAAFIQERLDGFMGTWGGAGLRVHRLGGAGEASALVVGVFATPGPAPRGSVRVYGRPDGGGPAVLAAVTHDGVPEVHPWPAARDGAPQLVATWLGAPSGSGGRPLAIELWRLGRLDGVERIWSSAAAYPEGLSALGVGVAADAVSIRYEPRYPGWTPGCAGQTEQIDVYRPGARRPGLALAGRRVVNGWHRELQAAVQRLLTALGGGDAAALAELVPDRALRSRLPRTLTREPACDEGGGGTPAAVAVAVTEARDGRPVPWSLTWRRAAKGWRLAAATRVLE